MRAWEESEARALRIRGPGALALSIWQKLKTADMDPALSLLPARGLAQLYFAGVDLVHLVDAMLVAPAGDLPLHLAEVHSWCRTARFFVDESARPFLLLLDRLQAAGGRDGVPAATPPETDVTVVAPPEAQGKLDGRFRQWHLLYERLDLKAEAEGIPPEFRQPLCRELAEVYEEFLLCGHELQGLLQATRPSWSRWVRFLSEVNATFHYHLGPRRLAEGRLDAGAAPAMGLPLRVLVALAARDGKAGSTGRP